MTTTTPRSTRLVPVGEVELCVESFGDPADPALLLLAGAAASMDSWPVAWCERLAASGHHVLRYDHRDTGRSTTGPPGRPAYDGSALDRDAEGLLRTLGLGPAHLVGLSMGGGIAQSLALRSPDLVAALTLVATSPVGGVDRETLPGVEARVADFFADPPPEPDWTDREAVVDWFLAGERAFAGPVGVDEAEAREAAEATFERSHDLAAAANHWLVVGEGGEDDDTTADVREITAPTLVVHGSHDPLFPLAHGEALASAVPGAHLLVVQGMGHQVPPRASWGQLVPAVSALTRG